MAERKSHVDQMLDLCLYGPLGLLVTARMKYPQMVAEGRKQLASARQARALRRPDRHQPGQAGGREGHEPAPGERPADRRLAGTGTQRRRVRRSRARCGRRPRPRTGTTCTRSPRRRSSRSATTTTTRPRPASVAADELAIPGYDSLAASQVVQRLDGLTDRELEAVRRYEVAHRARKTVLGKVAQLQRHP